MESNKAMFDRYSFAHASIGFAAGAIGVSPLLFFVGTIVWEVLEDHMKDTHPDLFPNPTHDSKLNALGDIICNLAGYSVAYGIKGK